MSLPALKIRDASGLTMPILNASSALTKDHIHKTTVLGVIGVKRTLADLLTHLTGQPLKYFDCETVTKDWLVEE